MSKKIDLKPCPCGKTPSHLNIASENCKWAYASGSCCGEWNIEFRTGYHELDSKECYANAVEAWNASPRKEDES